MINTGFSGKREAKIPNNEKVINDFRIIILYTDVRCNSTIISFCNLHHSNNTNTKMKIYKILYTNFRFYNISGYYGAITGCHSSSRSGRFFTVSSTDFSLRHFSIFAWCPLRSTSGTAIPLQTAGFVYWGYSRRPL